MGRPAQAGARGWSVGCVWRCDGGGGGNGNGGRGGLRWGPRRAGGVAFRSGGHAAHTRARHIPVPLVATPPARRVLRGFRVCGFGGVVSSAQEGPRPAACIAFRSGGHPAPTRARHIRVPLVATPPAWRVLRGFRVCGFGGAVSPAQEGPRPAVCIAFRSGGLPAHTRARHIRVPLVALPPARRVLRGFQVPGFDRGVPVICAHPRRQPVRRHYFSDIGQSTFSRCHT